MSLLDDIGDKLIADGVVEGATGWKLYKAYLPDSPDQCVVIYESPGPAPDQTGGTKYEFPGFQVFVRGADFGYSAARTKMQAIFNSLNDADIAGYVYIYAADSGPVLDEADKSDNRPVLFMSFVTMKAPDSAVITIDAVSLGFGPSVPVMQAGSTFDITIPSASMGAVGG